MFQPMIMGVLNVTPDSFSDGGKFLAPEHALTHASALYAQGADVIDIGGESSRPGATSVSVQEELDRILPVIEAIKREMPVLISIDTMKPEVMQAAVRLGVWMINDINALQSPGALEVLAQASCQICLMHKKGAPLTMQNHPHYQQDVIEEIKLFFTERIRASTEAGIDFNRLWLDPGIGFGKQAAHNLLILKRMEAFSSLGLPLMVGISRKSILGYLVNQPVEARDSVGLAAAVYLLLQGVKVIRTHDVGKTKEAVLMLEAILAA